MSYQLKVDEMLEAMFVSEHPRRDQWKRNLEDVANGIAVDLAAHLGVACAPGSFEGLGFAGTCVPFYPAVEGQPLPDVFAEHGFDDPDEWAPE